jgi:hypothetical protein
MVVDRQCPAQPVLGLFLRLKMTNPKALRLIIRKCKKGCRWSDFQRDCIEAGYIKEVTGSGWPCNAERLQLLHEGRIKRVRRGFYITVV